MSEDSMPSLDEKIAYHEEMERLAMQAGDFTEAEHHRKMQDIYSAIKGRQGTTSVSFQGQ